jgi:EAL domain-containing protein (putative c-di-GMP-specific phosphodiesterase class I)
VNISIAQLKSGTLPATLVEIAGETGMGLSNLCLELTESIVVDDIEQTMQILEELRSLGVQLSIDDFGTGYSSLSYLRRMPICEIKIDRSFISSLPNDQSNAILVTTIIQMAHAMNMRVVAEGVENQDQLQYLKELGCDMAQGYYFSKPVTESSFAERCRNVCGQPVN